jgi:hypothetical protein
MFAMPAYSALKSFDRTFISPIASSEGWLEVGEPNIVFVER